MRTALTERDLPALLVYSDVWRSNQGRFLTNFMPYWNRSLIVIPREGAPVLLCALSPRVYPWIKSVTIFEDIRPASKLMTTLEQLCAERGWSKLGVLDLPQLPVEIRSGLRGKIVDVSSEGITEPDNAEFRCGAAAVALARKALDGIEGRILRLEALERLLRRAGAEDLVIRVKPRGGGRLLGRGRAGALRALGEGDARAWAGGRDCRDCERRFDAALARAEDTARISPGRSRTSRERARSTRCTSNTTGLYYGDTCSGT